jgi:heme exporter protein D
MSFEDFLSMGGYAQFVWPSYGLVLIILIVNLVLPLRRRAEIQKSIVKGLRQAGRKQA